MSNTPQDPGAMSLPVLEFLDGSSTVLDSVVCLTLPSRSFKRNRKAFQAYENDNAGATGDGRMITGERTIDVLVRSTVSKTAEQRLQEIESALNTCATLRLDSATTIAVSGSTGVQSSGPFTDNDAGDLRVTLGYIPTTPTSSDGTHSLLGPL